jgi:phenylpyruvate tautomerase PptA (4-oxalocrotonate tautomerase family)
MPVAKLHIAKGKSSEHKKAIILGIQQAMASAFKIPQTDTIVLLTEHERGHIDGKDENFTYVEIMAIAGRSKDAKRQMYRELVDNACKGTALKPTDVLIMLMEMPKDNCGVRGGLMASEIDLGFKVNV